MSTACDARLQKVEAGGLLQAPDLSDVLREAFSQNSYNNNKNPKQQNITKKRVQAGNSAAVAGRLRRLMQGDCSSRFA